MANQWLRLWHDMPNDPKWKTIARVSGQHISLVQATYLHLLVDASRNVTRGHVNVTAEDLASALDVTDDAILAVLSAMQGRVLDGMALSGWDARQPKREDQGGGSSGAKSAAERKREQREREANLKHPNADDLCHEMSRNVTLDKDKDKDKDKSIKAEAPLKRGATSRGTRLPVDWSLSEAWLVEAKAIRPDIPSLEVKTIAESFRDYWVAKPGQAGVKLDWLATWRNWLRNQHISTNRPASRPALLATNAVGSFGADYSNAPKTVELTDDVM